MERYNAEMHQAIGQNPNQFAINEQTISQEISKVFSWMFFGLLLTTASSWFCYQAGEAYLNLISGFTGIIIMLAPLGIVFYLSARINKMTASAAGVTFLIFSLIMGVSLGTVFYQYNLGSIVSTFLTTSLLFAVMAGYGYVTKKDLTKMGSLLFFGLIGIIIASLVNIFLKNTMFDLVISAIGVIIFLGLTAYDTQKIKESIIYYHGVEGKASGRATIMGALALYLDFINLFLFLLRFMGKRD
jgi:uncharacterized protein